MVSSLSLSHLVEVYLMVLERGGSSSWSGGEGVHTDGAQCFPAGGGDGYNDQGALGLWRREEGGREGGEGVGNE